MSANMAVRTKGRDAKKRIAASGSVFAAILTSSCCIVPLVLVTLGASGAWIGNLTALEPYQPIFATVTFVFLGFGFWHVYRTPSVRCEEDSYCATPASDLIAKGALWTATILVLLALTIDFWAPLFY